MAGSARWRTWLSGFRPAPTSVSVKEQMRSALGALVGILVTGAVSTWSLGATGALPFIIAPMGASAILLFAVPSSPLAQPWSIVGGNLVASLVGVEAAHLLPQQPLVAASAAIGVAIALMFVLRCIHPPSGAVTLTAVLGGPAVAKLGFGFVLAPVLLNSLLLVLVALGFNNATRRRYPHAQQESRATQDSRRGYGRAAGFTPDDLDAVLARYDEVLDIARPDMDALFQAAEMRAFQRHLGAVTCADIMSRGVVSVEWGTPLEEAWTLMRKRKLRSMPVTDKGGRVLGLVNDLDFLTDLGLHSYKSMRERFRRLIRPVEADFPGVPEVVGQIMVKDVPTARTTAHIGDLLPMLAASGLRHVPIVDERRLLVGIVSQSDLIAALYRRGLGA